MIFSGAKNFQITGGIFNIKPAYIYPETLVKAETFAGNRNIDPGSFKSGLHPMSSGNTKKVEDLEARLRQVETVVETVAETIRGDSERHYNAYIPPPSDQSVPNKRRKGTDAAQDRVLNKTYVRTAFPAREEREVLAKTLGMSQRSVQKWFKKKRRASVTDVRNRNSSGTIASSPPNLSRHV
ncbi:hypothetical protein DFH07DRAFT_778367 [Mycena maculata]|uniref:Homeobox domain-containing protein n=1 Tax=Mycena maculata TaxID=230809 RepID=A0AAD7IEE9_9AGAR|nr:hypothetical protein DFH07DRAFT_778367 [Mycena maculata]